MYANVAFNKFKLNVSINYSWPKIHIYFFSFLLWYLFICSVVRGFNKYQRPTKRVGYFAQRSRLLFTRKKMHPWRFNNVVNEKYILTSQWKRNYDLCSNLRRNTGFMVHFSSLVMSTLYLSQFSTLLLDLPRMCSRANDWVVVICVNCLKEFITWLMNQNLSESYIFLNQK